MSAQLDQTRQWPAQQLEYASYKYLSLNPPAALQRARVEIGTVLYYTSRQISQIDRKKSVPLHSRNRATGMRDQQLVPKAPTIGFRC